MYTSVYNILFVYKCIHFNFSCQALPSLHEALPIIRFPYQAPEQAPVSPSFAPSFLHLPYR